MEIEKTIERLLGTFESEDFKEGAEELALVNELGAALSKAGVIAGGEAFGLDLPVVEELLTWRIVTLHAQGRLRKDGMFPGSGAEAKLRVQTHPALEVMAKAYERYRKVMKELLERLESAGEGPRRGLPSIMKPILEKAEGVLEDALEYQARKESAEKKRSETRGNPGVVESP